MFSDSEDEIHVTFDEEEELEKFDDNVNSAQCGCFMNPVWIIINVTEHNSTKHIVTTQQLVIIKHMEIFLESVFQLSKRTNFVR